MNQCTVKTTELISCETLAQPRILTNSCHALDRCGAYIGLDVHKDTIALADALPGRTPARFRCEIGNKPENVVKLIDQLNQEFGGECLLFCYETGPCGYVLNPEFPTALFRR